MTFIKLLAVFVEDSHRTAACARAAKRARRLFLNSWLQEEGRCAYVPMSIGIL